MTYIDNIKELGSPSLDEIIKNAYNNLSGNRRRTPWIGLSHGVDLLKNADDLNQYLCAYGKMHQEKLNLAFKYIDDYLWGTTEISIVDYGCGQGLASIALADFMHQHKYSVDCIKEIILIEPSRLCLKRAESYVRSVYPKTDVKVLNKDINNLTPDDILSSSSLTIHLFSNILDIESLNLKRLSTVINISRDFDKSHVFVCVGPYFGLRHKDQKVTIFLF